MERRTYLATACSALSAGFAGCGVLGGPTHERAEDAWDVDREEGTILDAKLTGTVALDAGRYAAQDLAPERDARYRIEFEVVDGGAVDVFVMGSGWFEDQYRGGSDDLQYTEALSALSATESTLRGEVTRGEYRLVVDNTGVYGAEPEGSVEVDVELTAGIAE